VFTGKARFLRWGHAVNTIASEVTDILVFHLGIEEAKITDGASLTEDLGADSLDVAEILMSCEEKFDIRVPDLESTGLRTVGDVVTFVEAQVIAAARADRARQPLGLAFALR
jgi:acyl carrier protein